ncbi:MAG: type II toxin-antitoxin system VapB family antitoxin [Gemmatimonadales bacterium]
MERKKGKKRSAPAPVRPREVRESRVTGEAAAEAGLRKASLFMNGRSQAVRLPKEFRFEGTHVYARKEGDRVVLSPVDDRWERFLAAFGSIPDFPGRDQPPLQERPELDAWIDAPA